MAIAIVTMVFLVSLLWGALSQPGRAFGFLAMLILLKVAEIYPATLLALLVAALTISATIKD